MTALAMVTPTSARQARPPAYTLDPRLLVNTIQREHHAKDEEKIVELVANYLRDHTELLTILARGLVRSALIAQRQSTRRRVDRQRDCAEVAAIAERIKATIVLDMPCPNGKRLRLCTGAECAAFGRTFGKIAQHVGADELVGEVLIEAEARQLLEAAP